MRGCCLLFFAFSRRRLWSWQSNNCGDEPVKIGATEAEKEINACVVFPFFFFPSNLPARNWRRRWCFKYSGTHTLDVYSSASQRVKSHCAVFLLCLRYISWQPALLMFFGFQTRKPFVNDLSPLPQLCQRSVGLLYRLLFLESWCWGRVSQVVLFTNIIHTLKKWLFQIIVTWTSVSISSWMWLKRGPKSTVRWLHATDDYWTWCLDETVGTTQIFMYFRLGSHRPTVLCFRWPNHIHMFSFKASCSVEVVQCCLCVLTAATMNTACLLR